MTFVFGIIIVGLMIMVVITLVRGIVAFLGSTKEDLNRAPGDGPTPNQLLQNRMMFKRIQYQALAILVCAILLAMAR